MMKFINNVIANWKYSLSQDERDTIKIGLFITATLLTAAIISALPT